MRRIVVVLVLIGLAACGDEAGLDEPALRAEIAELHPNATDDQVDEIIEAVEGYCAGADNTQRIAQAIAIDEGAPERIALWEAACPSD